MRGRGRGRTLSAPVGRGAGGVGALGTGGALDERTALLGPRGALYGAYDDQGSREREAGEIEAREREVRAALRREEEAVFGRWPWRLLNHYVSAPY